MSDQLCEACGEQVYSVVSLFCEDCGDTIDRHYAEECHSDLECDACSGCDECNPKPQFSAVCGDSPFCTVLQSLQSLHDLCEDCRPLCEGCQNKTGCHDPENCGSCSTCLTLEEHSESCPWCTMCGDTDCEKCNYRGRSDDHDSYEIGVWTNKMRALVTERVLV